MKLICKFLLLAIFIGCNNSNAQSPNWEWSKKIGGWAYEEGKDITIDPQGNVLVTGWYGSPNVSFDSTVISGVGNYGVDMFLAKYDTSGNLLWVNKSGNKMKGECLAVSSTGSVYVSGTFCTDTMDFVSALYSNLNVGICDDYIAKYDENGNFIHVNTIKGDRHEYIYEMKTSNTGELYVTGTFDGDSIVLDSVTFFKSGYTDMYLAKYDSIGNLIWANSVGGNRLTSALGLANDSFGNFYVAGLFNSDSLSFGNTTLINTSNGLSDLFVCKYNSSGNVLWAKSFGGAKTEGGINIVVDRYNDVYISGNFSSNIIYFDSIPVTNPLPNGERCFFVKLDSSGVVKWAKSYGTLLGNGDNVRDMSIDSVGSIYVMGNYLNSSVVFSNITLPNSGMFDMYIAKFDSSGSTLWVKSVSNIYSELGSGIAVGKSSDLYVIGEFDSLISFGSFYYANNGKTDAFVAKLVNTITAIDELDKNDQIVIFPNPASDNFTINNKENLFFDVSIVDTNGKTVYNANNVKSHELIINATSFAQGVYLVRLMSSKSVSTQKLLVIK